MLPVLATPFSPDGTLDRRSLRRLVEYELAAGVDALVCFGLASESAKLSDDERRQVLIDVLAAVAGAVPVVAGVDHPSGFVAAQRARQAAELGAAVVMAAPPNHRSSAPAEIADFYAGLVEAGCRVVIVQDAPGWTGVNLEVDLLAQLVADVPAEIVIKVEAAESAAKVAALSRRGIAAFGGSGAVHLAEEMAAGIAGTMPGCALPDCYVRIWQRHVAGDRAGSRLAWQRALPWLVAQMASLDTFISAQKQLLCAAGVLDSATVRAPGKQLSSDQWCWIKECAQAVSAPRGDGADG